MRSFMSSNIQYKKVTVVVNELNYIISQREGFQNNLRFYKKASNLTLTLEH